MHLLRISYKCAMHWLIPHSHSSHITLPTLCHFFLNLLSQFSASHESSYGDINDMDNLQRASEGNSPSPFSNNQQPSTPPIAALAFIIPSKKFPEFQMSHSHRNYL